MYSIKRMYQTLDIHLIYKCEMHFQIVLHLFRERERERTCTSRQQVLQIASCSIYLSQRQG